MYGDIDTTPIASTTSDTFTCPFIQLQGASFNGWSVNIYRKICVATGTSAALNATVSTTMSICWWKSVVSQNSPLGHRALLPHPTFAITPIPT
mmetsp:Transcript_5226/g.10307  ORF Transcript_5226/g.10307 Transcript_5226/m.10307 type:complete len:93 (-) Transcript_5226:195-473(-)